MIQHPCFLLSLSAPSEKRKSLPWDEHYVRQWVQYKVKWVNFLSRIEISFFFLVFFKGLTKKNVTEPPSCSF